ncbi:MAG: hypothetical protein IPO08_23820 [Xanthomonadales bacterium]|nr:hypothetical protein [Xanthomonadales bacterium]
MRYIYSMTGYINTKLGMQVVGTSFGVTIPQTSSEMVSLTLNSIRHFVEDMAREGGFPGQVIPVLTVFTPFVEPVEA